MLADPAAATQSTARADRVDTVRNSILNAILEHQLLPGTKLGEDELGSIYGVSRTLIRLALQILATEGVVVIEKNRGAFVAKPGPQETREVFEARRLIEAEIARLAATRVTSAAAAQLQAHLDEEHRALARHDEKETIRLSGLFHQLVAQISGHAVYSAMLAELIGRSSLSILLYKSDRRHLCGDDHHARIAAALVRGDSTAAGQLMVEHLNEIEHGLALDNEGAKPTTLSAILRHK